MYNNLQSLYKNVRLVNLMATTCYDMIDNTYSS